MDKTHNDNECDDVRSCLKKLWDKKLFSSANTQEIDSFSRKARKSFFNMFLVEHNMGDMIGKIHYI